MNTSAYWSRSWRRGSRNRLGHQFILLAILLTTFFPLGGCSRSSREGVEHGERQPSTAKSKRTIGTIGASEPSGFEQQTYEFAFEVGDVLSIPGGDRTSLVHHYYNSELCFALDLPYFPVLLSDAANRASEITARWRSDRKLSTSTPMATLAVCSTPSITRGAYEPNIAVMIFDDAPNDLAAWVAFKLSNQRKKYSDLKLTSITRHQQMEGAHITVVEYTHTIRSFGGELDIRAREASFIASGRIIQVGFYAPGKEFQQHVGAFDACFHSIRLGQSYIESAKKQRTRPGVISYRDKFPPKGLPPHSAIVFAPDGRHFATGGADGVITLWAYDLNTGFERLASNRAHRGAVETIAFAPDGKTLISGGADGGVRLWQVPTLAFASELRTATTYPGDVRVLSVAFHPTANLAAFTDDFTGATIWDLSSRKRVKRWSGEHPPTTAAWSRDLRYVAFASGIGVTVKDFLEDRHFLVPLPLGNATAVAIRPDGEELAVGLAISQPGQQRTTCQVLIYTLPSLESRVFFTGYMSSASSLRFSDNGDLLLAVGDGKVIVCEGSGSTLKLIRREATAACFSADSKMLISGHDEGRLRLSDLQSGEHLVME